MTNEKKTRNMSQWVNLLGFEDRKIIIQLYSGGLSISAITRIYQVHHSTIRYHLMEAGVYVKNKKPGVTFKLIQKANIDSALNFHNTKGKTIKVIPKRKIFELGYDNEESHFPKSYEEYVQRDRERSRLRLKQHASI